MRGRNRFNNYDYNSPYASMYGTPNTAMFMNVAGVQVPITILAIILDRKGINQFPSSLKQEAPFII